jgi:hypothetical protein
MYSSNGVLKYISFRKVYLFFLSIYFILTSITEVSDALYIKRVVYFSNFASLKH